MTPATRVALAVAVVVASALLVLSAASDHWFHSPLAYVSQDLMLDWDGFGGPSDGDVGLSGSDLVSIVAGFSSLLAALCGLVVGLGAIAGRRRDHVPRMVALFASAFALAAILFQAIAVFTWPISKQPEPHGFGWAMPVYFIAGIALLIPLVLLWRDASQRARASAAALAKVDRELAARDLATIPDAEPDEPPVERV